MSVDLDRLAAAVERELMTRDGKERGDEIICRCPAPDHPDKNPSYRYHKAKRAYMCDPCGASGGLLTGSRPLVPLLGLDPDDYTADGGSRPRRERSWKIRDPEGRVVAEHHRKDLPGGDKRVWWTYNGQKGLGGTKTADLPLYRSEHLGEREPGDDMPIFVVEGEPTADSLAELGVPVVATVTGASSAPGPKALQVLEGRNVVTWADADDSGREHLARVAEGLDGVAGTIRAFEPEGLPPGGDAVEWVAQAGDEPLAELLEAVEAEATVPAALAPPEFTRLDEGSYRLTLPRLGIQLTADHLKRKANYLRCELAVRCELAGAKTVDDGMLSIGDFNLSSTRSRQSRAKYLAKRAQTGDDVDWEGLLERFAQQVLAAEKEGEPAVVLSSLPRPEPDESLNVGGLVLPARQSSIVFGDGGSAKSYLGLYIRGTLAQRGKRVAFFDWEFSGQDHRDRLERLFGPDMPEIVYARCSRPFAHEVDRLKRIVRDHGIDYAIFDSISFATNGPAEAHEAANDYFQALRQLGDMRRLHTAHRKKGDDDNSTYKPFGSVFWYNGARSIWYVRLADGSPGDPEITSSGGILGRRRAFPLARARPHPQGPTVIASDVGWCWEFPPARAGPHPRRPPDSVHPRLRAAGGGIHGCERTRGEGRWGFRRQIEGFESQPAGD